jgi:hypothetical protein
MGVGGEARWVEPVRRRASATVARSLRRAVTWKPKRAGEKAIDISELISPLRYDVLVRAQFFDFLQSRPEGEPDDALMLAAQHEPYAVWFREVAMARFRPWVLRDPAVMADNFTERVLSARALLRSFHARGFDPSKPVTLRLTRWVTPSDTGAPMQRTVHVGDGGHRLAMLLQAGRALEPSMYRLDPRPMPLIDNTAVLHRALGLTDEQYLAFVARAYTADPVPDLAALRAVVAAQGPQAAAELEGVLTAHGRDLSTVG